jgi:probable phosphoglycerate mutase
MSTRFIVVRHGETHWNVAGRIQGHGNSSLTETGRAQADAIAARLAAEPFDAIVASDLGRAFDTAQAIARDCKLPIATDPRLRERSFGIGEGLTYEEIDRQYPDIFSRVRSTDPDAPIPGGESRREFHERVRAAFEALAREYDGRRVTVVTHGGVLSSLFRHVHGIGLEQPQRIPISNASYNAVTIGPGGWTMEAWDDVAHLPAAAAFEDV